MTTVKLRHQHWAQICLLSINFFTSRFHFGHLDGGTVVGGPWENISVHLDKFILLWHIMLLCKPSLAKSCSFCSSKPFAKEWQICCSIFSFSCTGTFPFYLFPKPGQYLVWMNCSMGTKLQYCFGFLPHHSNSYSCKATMLFKISMFTEASK
jgi:hypothetical protein